MPNTESSPVKYLKCQPKNSFYLFPTSATEIETEITKLKVNKSAGPFSIPIGVFKFIKSILSKPLETVFNASFITGVVADKFKIARVFPIFKNGLESNVSNYPQSHFSQFSVKS